MSILKFNDGEEFDLSGPFRVEKRYDGWYVVGENRLIPVRDEAEGLLYIQEQNEDLGPEYDSAGFTEEDRIINGQYRNISNQ